MRALHGHKKDGVETPPEEIPAEDVFGEDRRVNGNRTKPAVTLYGKHTHYEYRDGVLYRDGTPQPRHMEL